MPTIGLRRAFNSRGWKVATTNPVQILTIASEFGIGYNTLITHLAITLRDMSQPVRTALEKWTPQRIRKMLLSDDSPNRLVILDDKQTARCVDFEAGDTLAVPSASQVDGDIFKHKQTIRDFDVYAARGRGRATLTTPSWKVEARIAPKRFVGLAKYRFLEDPDE